jgi:histidinol-phosphatase (PHP family)
MLTDYHMHMLPDDLGEPSGWHDHGWERAVDWMRRYVERARSRAVGEIAFTEHVNRFTAAHGWHSNAWWRGVAVEDLDRYREAVQAAKDAGLPVLFGIEMDWLPERKAEIAALLDAHPFDVVLGSVHFLDDLAVDHQDWDRLSAEEVWSEYLEQLAAAARSGLFDVLAHPDLPKVWGRRFPPALAERRDATIDAIAVSGVAIECSSAGLRKPVRDLYPDPDWLARFRAAGVPATLASDAHRPEDVARDYPTAVAALRGAGYDTITRFRARKGEQVSLRWE